MSDHDHDFDDVRAPGGSQGAQAPVRRARMLMDDRDPAAALEVLEPALEDAPGDRGLRTLRAWAYLMRAQLVLAERDLQQLVAEDPSDAWARHALGRALERQSRRAEALPHLRLAEAMTGDAIHRAARLRVEAAVGAA